MRTLPLVALVLLSHVCFAAELRLEGRVDTSRAAHEIGHCYTVPLETPAPPDSPYGGVSRLRLYEDGRELGPAHSLHQAIRDLGRGRFSHWSGNASGEPQGLYFSASDNSDPRANGRVYRWRVARGSEEVRRALHVGLVHGSLLVPPRQAAWYVAARLDHAFPPFTAARPPLELQPLDASGKPVGRAWKLELTPRQWVPLAPLSDLPREARAVRAKMPLRGHDSKVRYVMAEFTLSGRKSVPLEVTGEAWRFQAQGPWVDVPDQRGLRAMRYPWRISTTGEYAELSRQVTVPQDWRAPYSLTFFCSDDYTDDGSRPEESGNSVDAYPGHRLKQALVDGKVVWEQDIADNSAPFAATDFAVDLSSHAQPGQTFTLALRNFDRVGLDTALPTDFYLRGVYEGDRPGGDHVLATTCYWGDVTLWEGALTEGPAWPRPSSAAVQRRHAARQPAPGGKGAKLPVALSLEGAAEALPADTPVVCGVPLPQGLVKGVGELSLALGKAALPWQPEVMNTWPDGSPRWVMVNTVLAAGTPPDATVVLARGVAGKPAAPAAPVRARTANGVTTLSTGDLRVVVAGNGEELVRGIIWAGREVVRGLRAEATWQVGEQTRQLTATWGNPRVLRRGPVRVTVEVPGTLADGAGALGPVIARLDVFAGSPTIRLTYRLINAGAERADLSLVRLTARTGLDGDRRSACAAPGGTHETAAATLRLSHRDADHCVLTVAGQEQVTPGRAEGWVATGDGRGWVQGVVRHFWQQFPAAAEVTPDSLSLDLIAAEGGAAAYGCRAGEAKRWETWLSFGSGPMEAKAAALAAAPLLRPLRLFDATHFCASEGLVRAVPHGEAFAAVRDHMANTYPNADHKTMALLFGVRDFGDGYYTQATPSYRNNYYDVMRGMFGEYLMGGGGAWFDRGEEAARHYTDLDQFHDSARSHEQRGANASVYTPNHNDEFGIWSAMLRPAGGMLTYWRLSGDEDARESALMLADYIVRAKAGQGAGSVRDNAGSLHSLVWAYDETRDRRYLDSALALAASVRQFLIPRRGCYAENHGSMNYRGNVPWMVAQLVEPLEMLYRQSGEEWVADMAVGLMESVVCENMEPGNPGNFQGYTHDPVLHRGGWQSGYNVLIAPCVGLAYELSGDESLRQVMHGAYRLTVDEKTINDVRNCYWMTPTLLYLLSQYP